MITPSFSPTATERVLPKLALDFTTATLDPRVTFTRTTDATHPATYINSSGYVTLATNNQPRFDYDPVTLACKGLLIEESRANIIPKSTDFSAWTKGSGVTLATSTEIAPDGTQTATDYTSSSYIAYIYSGASPATTYTFSVWVKSATGVNQNFFLYVEDNGGTPTTVTKTNTATTSWQRFFITTTSNNPTSLFRPSIRAGHFYIWGAQLEVGAFPTSYIPTTSAALTRNADVATMTGTNFSSWWTTTTGGASVYATQKTISGTRPLFQVDDNTSSNQICLRGNGANPELYIKATSDQVQIDAGTIVANTAYKFTGAWNTNNCAAAQNGAAVVTDTSATIPTVTQARIGCDGTNYANSWLMSINYWSQRITDNETQAFSK